jgi:hypothetical protein
VKYCNSVLAFEESDSHTIDLRDDADLPCGKNLIQKIDLHLFSVIEKFPLNPLQRIPCNY